jgi:hypothetical protein
MRVIAPQSRMQVAFPPAPTKAEIVAAARRVLSTLPETSWVRDRPFPLDPAHSWSEVVDESAFVGSKIVAHFPDLGRREVYFTVTGGLLPPGVANLAWSGPHRLRLIGDLVGA